MIKKQALMKFRQNILGLFVATVGSCFRSSWYNYVACFSARGRNNVGEASC